MEETLKIDGKYLINKNSTDYIVGITVNNSKKEKTTVLLPCEEEKINTFYQVLENWEQKKFKSINIYSKYGIKVLEGRGKIVGINDSLYKDKQICNLSKNDFKKFIVLLNIKLKKLKSLSTYSDIVIISDNIDDIISLTQDNSYQIFKNKTLDEIATENKIIKTNDNLELNYIMNSLGYFQINNIVVKVDTKHLNNIPWKKEVVDNYTTYLCYNTEMSLTNTEHMSIKVLNKTLPLKIDVLKLFDEYCNIKCKKNTEKNLLKAFKEEYWEYFEKEYNKCNDDGESEEYINYKFWELMSYRDFVQKDLLEYIENYYNTESDWFFDLFDFTKPKEIEKYYNVETFKEEIEDFLTWRIETWYSVWIKT